MLEAANNGGSLEPLSASTHGFVKVTQVYKALLCTGYLEERKLVVWASITAALHTANLVREERNPGLDLPCGKGRRVSREDIDRVRHAWDPTSAPFSPELHSLKQTL